jgi:hypothetical protein
MKPYRVAVCLSGQARTWRSAFPNLKRFFDDIACYEPWDTPHEVKVDYFCHTWDTNTWWREEDKYAEGNNAPLSEEDKRDLPVFYDAVSHVIEPSIEQTNGRRWDGMLYSFMRSILLKRDYELQHNFEYDLVIKARYDIVFDPDLRFRAHPITPLTAYTSNDIVKFPREYYQNDFHDVMFWGDSLTMDLVADTVRDLGCPEQLIPAEPDQNACLRYGPGVLLYRHLVSLGIHPTTDFTPSYTVVREKAAGLDPLTKDGYTAIRNIMLSEY